MWVQRIRICLFVFHFSGTGMTVFGARGVSGSWFFCSWTQSVARLIAHLPSHQDPCFPSGPPLRSAVRLPVPGPHTPGGALIGRFPAHSSAAVPRAQPHPAVWGAWRRSKCGGSHGGQGSDHVSSPQADGFLFEFVCVELGEYWLFAIEDTRLLNIDSSVSEVGTQAILRNGL